VHASPSGKKTLSIQGGGEFSALKHNSEFDELAVHIGVESTLHKNATWPLRSRQYGSEYR
jgi:hypothetical protein